MATTLSSGAVNLAAYLGLDTTDREPGHGPRNWAMTARERRLAIDTTEEGTIAREIAEALSLVVTAPGETRNDARYGRQGALESLLLSWPDAPRYSADWYDALRERVWLRQGADWEYGDTDARAIFDALVGGESADSVRDRVRAADPALITSHRHASDGRGRPSRFATN